MSGLSLAGLFLACAVTAIVARLGLQRLDPGQEALGRVPLISLFLVTWAGAGIAFAAAWSEGFDTTMGLVQAFLVGQLLLAGWIDRQTTWVPDFVLLSVLTAASAYVLTYNGLTADLIRLLQPVTGFTPFNAFSDRPFSLVVLVSIVTGIGIWLITLVLWGVQVMLGKCVLTPPDIVALGLPFFLFGVSIETGIVYAVVVLLALMLQRSPFLRSRFSNDAAVSDGKAHLGLDEDAPAVAVLSLMFGILSLAIIARGPLNATLAAVFF